MLCASFIQLHLSIPLNTNRLDHEKPAGCRRPHLEHVSPEGVMLALGLPKEHTR
jgi:hypothetical protein